MARSQDKTLAHRVALVIRELREEIGVSQADVYNDINIHIGRIESTAPNLNLSTLEAIAKYFRIKLSDLFMRAENIKF